MPKPEMHSSRVSRRALLKWGAAAAGFAGLSYLGRKWYVSEMEARSAYEKMREEKIAAVMANPSISTRGIGVRGVIERTPEIASKEMSWYKSGVGELRESNLNRFSQMVESVFPRKGDRSDLHTHPYNALVGLPEHLKGKLMSTFSPLDVQKLISLNNHANAPMRTIHSAAVDSMGKVMGYCTYRISKRLAGNSVALKQLKKLADYYSLVFAIANDSKDWQYLNKLADDFNVAIIKDYGKNGNYMKNGLLIHRTPLPGYIFKNGSFQKKV